jgi:acyl-CoA dehydrogenase
MDIQAGAAISLGPRNTLAHAYFAVPISITVEGANILTRTLMVFGQGAIRCHPFVLDQINAMETRNLSLFNIAFWGHVGHVIQNSIRLKWLYITRGLFVRTPGGPLRRYYQKLSWTSSQFAVFADIAMATLGGNLKRREQLTGRFADVFSWMYMATSVLRRFEHEGRPKETQDFAEWSLQYAFAHIQQAFDGIFQNMGKITVVHRYWSRINPIGTFPSDTLSQQLAHRIQQPGTLRDDLTQGIHHPTKKTDYQAQLERAFKSVSETEGYSKKVIQAIRKGRLKQESPEILIQSAINEGILTKEEAEKLLNAETLRRAAIEVDDFSQEAYLKTDA